MDMVCLIPFLVIKIDLYMGNSINAMSVPKTLNRMWATAVLRAETLVLMLARNAVIQVPILQPKIR